MLCYFSVCGGGEISLAHTARQIKCWEIHNLINYPTDVSKSDAKVTNQLYRNSSMMLKVKPISSDVRLS